MALPILELEQPVALPIQISNITKPFWQGLTEGRFITRYCKQCSYITFPPKEHCPNCLSKDMNWQELNGKGTLYSYTIVHAAPPMFSPLPLYVAVIDLEEGVRLVTHLLDCQYPEPGIPVNLVITKHNNGYLFAAKPT